MKPGDHAHQFVIDGGQSVDEMVPTQFAAGGLLSDMMQLTWASMCPSNLSKKKPGFVRSACRLSRDYVDFDLAHHHAGEFISMPSIWTGPEWKSGAKEKLSAERIRAAFSFSRSSTRRTSWMASGISKALRSAAGNFGSDDPPGGGRPMLMW